MESIKSLITLSEAMSRKILLGIKETFTYYILTNWVFYVFSAIFLIGIAMDYRGYHPGIAMIFIIVSVIAIWLVILNSHNKLLRQIMGKVGLEDTNK